MKQYLLFVLISGTCFATVFSQNQLRERNQTDETEALRLYFQDQQGPFGAYSMEQEVVALRTEFSKHFKNPDGSYTAIIGAGPLHYRENGHWLTILSFPLENKGKEYTNRKWAAVHNKHKMYFPERPGLSIVTKIHGQLYEDWAEPVLVWLDANGRPLQEIKANAASRGKASRDSLVYADIFPYTDAVILNSITSKKLNYILRSPAFLASKPAGAAYLAFREEIKAPAEWALAGTGVEKPPFSANNASQQFLQDISFKNTSGEPMLNILRPVYFERMAQGSCSDTEFDTTKRNPDAVMEGSYVLKKKNAGSYTTYILVPLSWLEAAHRKFPVTIDPVTDYYPGGTWPTHTANRPNNSGSWYCYVGTYAGRVYVYDISYGWIDDTWPFENPYMDGYASFNISSIPTNAVINSATTYWYRYGGRTCGDAIFLKHGMVQYNEYLANQPSCDVDGQRVRNNNGYYNGTGKNGTGWQSQAASTTDVTNALSGGQITMGWAYNGGDDCCTGCFLGVCACTGNDGDYHHIYGYQHSTLKPYIRIDYCVKPTITAHPSDIYICTSGSMPALSVTASGTALTYQWQVSNNTACSGASNWQNISGATNATYTPPKIAGTRLYRVVVTASDCPSGLSGRTVNSNCARVVVNVMNGTSNAPAGFPSPHGTGDNPPPIQFSNCGGLVLPGSSHILGTLQPPAIGAVNQVTSYSWSASGGSFTGTGSSVTWTAPTALGTYTITVTYNTSCGSFQSTCNVEVASPHCNYAYVRPAANGGVDASDRGGPDNPYATLAYAISQLGGRTHIRMATGNYTETQRVDIPSNVIIEGRYDAANGWRKQNDGSTNITFSATTTGSNPTVTEVSSTTRHLIGMAANGTSNWTLQDINVTTSAVTGTSSGGRGSSNYALWLNGASNYNIIRCQFTSGNASAGENGANGANGANGGNGGSGQTDSCNDSDFLSGGAGGAGGNNSWGGDGGNGGRGGNAAGNGRRSRPCNGSAGQSTNVAGGSGGTTPGTACQDNYSSHSCSRADGEWAYDNATAGNNGTPSYSPGSPASPNHSFGTYYVPSSQAAQGGHGSGGGGGAGGGSSSGEDCWYWNNNYGNSGGGGGGGGGGGQGGFGGFGGGGSFGIYRNNSNTGANLVDIVVSSGTAGAGGSGGSGGAGGSGGNGGSGNGGCSGDRATSAGGRPGKPGGAGGRGQDGAPGVSYQMYVVGSGASNPSTSIPTSPVVRILHDKGKPCINSEINLYKASGTWTLPSGLTFVNDRNETQTSYTTSSTNIKIYSTTTNATYDLTAPADFPGFLRIVSDNRPLPVITISPTSLCEGAGAEIQLTHTNAWGTQVEYEWVIFSAVTNNANSPLITINSSNPLVDVSALAAGSYKVRYRVREICCGWSRPVYASFTITPQPTQPNDLTKTAGSNFAQACEGTTGLSVNAATGSTGGAGTCVYEYAYQNTDGVWSDWQTAIPSLTAGVAPGYVRIKARRVCDGLACEASPETPAVEWEIFAQPVAGAVTRSSPSEQYVCIGASLVPTITGGTGGISATDEIQWRKGTSGSWNAYTGPINTATYGTGEYYFQTKRTTSGAGCNNTAWEPAGNGSLLWFVVDDPVAPLISKNPSDANVCIGAQLTVNVTQFGSGGAGSCQDEMRYSTNGGTSWSAWSTSVPNITATASGTVIMESRRNCSASGCNSNVNSVSWTVVIDPALSNPVLSNPSICVGGSSNVTSNLTGGTGTMNPVWEYYNGSAWVTVSNNTPAGATYTNTTSATMTISGITATGSFQYRRRLPATGIGCDATSASVTLTVVADPTWATNVVTPTSACLSAPITLNASFSGGVGGSVSWVRATSPGGSGTTVTSPDTPPLAGTYYYRPVYNATVSGCNLADGTETAVVISQPNLTSINASVSPVMATNDYLWNGLNSANWNSASNWYVLNGSNFVAATSIPTSTTNVYIVSQTTAVNCVSGTNHATVSSTESARNLYLDNDATLIISGSNVLNVHGNWTSEATSTFTYNTSKVVFKGNTNNTITSNGKKFYNVDIEKSASNKITVSDNYESVNKTHVISGTLEVPATITGKAKTAEVQTGANMNILSNGTFVVNP
ncbi:MAG: hypothetical protein KatS3mg031_1520 [Chitinophagales bacterium]|nr:MAG: hypothetical protein KatS3mg031_1520 [Chitinophagales bacterium]